MVGSPRQRSRRRHGFSVASILLLTAVVAIFFAAITTGLKDPDRLDSSALAFFGVGGSILGGLVGVVIGLNQIRPIRGLLLGLPSGSISGAMAGVLLVVPQGFLAMIVGAIVLLVFAVVVRCGSQPTALFRRRCQGKHQSQTPVTHRTSNTTALGRKSHRLTKSEKNDPS